MLPQTQPHRVILEVTNRCNLDCSICLQRSWSEASGSMSAAVFSQLIRDLSGFSSPPEIFFGGYGEPLSHPEILEMVSQASAIGSKTSLISNGSLLTPDLADELVEAGLNKLWISVDSAHQAALERNRPRDDQPDLVNRLAGILESSNGRLEKLDPGLALVLTGNNQEQILRFLDQGIELGFRSYFLTNLEAYTAAQAEQLPYSLEDLRWPGSWRQAAADLLVQIERRTARDPGLSITGVFSRRQERCPFAERGDLVLRWDGEASPCLPLLYDRTIRIGSWEHKQQSYSQGNIRQHALSAIWEDAAASQLRERLLNQEFSPCLSCRDCWLSEDNLQDCMGFSHPACGGCLWAAGLVSCP